MAEKRRSSASKKRRKGHAKSVEHSHRRTRSRRGSFRRKKKNKKKILLWVLLAFLLVDVLAVAAVYFALHRNRVGVVDPDEVDPNADQVKIAQQDAINDDVINVLIVGSDSRDPDAEMGRSDSMMLLSYNKEKNKATLVSFLRDSLIDIEGHGKSKLGHTYAYGGVGLTINTINETFDLDIQDYVVANFDSLVNVIDEIGGVEVQITQEEAEYYETHGIPGLSAGAQTLTGTQALAHARNRHLDNDFGRTRRQRDVVYGVFNKVKQMHDTKAVMSLVRYGLTQVSTNMGTKEIYSLTTEILGADNLEIQQASIPSEGTYDFDTYQGMSVVTLDIDANKEVLKTLLY